MASPGLILALLFTICLSCVSFLEPWYQKWSGAEERTGDALSVIIGDSRRLFANQITAKADAYFHSGYYPTIFDDQKREEESHLSGEGESEADETDEDEHSGHVHSEHCDHGADENDGEPDYGFLGSPKDWIDRFGRNFFPTRHSHLEKGGEREILPWLRLSAQLDPQRIDSYTVASYWLRKRLNKPEEAEKFLREGLRANPHSYELYFELGQVYAENKNDPERARNLWELALRKWLLHQKADLEPDDFAYEQITGNLARVEENAGNLDRAILYLKMLKEKSPVPDSIQRQIDELQRKSRTCSAAFLFPSIRSVSGATDFPDGTKECNSTQGEQPGSAFHCEHPNPKTKNESDSDPNQTSQKKFHAQRINRFAQVSSPARVKPGLQCAEHGGS